MEGADDRDNGWIDISVPVRPEMPVWPGDPPVEIERTASLDAGDPATVSRLSLGSHSGTHMDAPAHFIRDGATMDDLPLDAVIGPARVIEIVGLQVIGQAALRDHAVREGERLLLRTENSERAWRAREFVEDFAHLDESAARHLAERHVRLIGIDYLSVAGFGTDPAPVHRTLLSAGVWIVEGLNLSGVEPGLYDIVCLPLRIGGADGAPARTLLRRRRSIGHSERNE